MTVVEASQIIETFISPEGRVDPYPLYAEARKLGPVVEAWPGILLVSGYAEVNEVLRNPAFGHTGAEQLAAISPESAGQAALAVIGRSVLEANPPDHKRMRSLMSSVFTPRRTGGLEPAIVATAERLLDAMAEAGRGGAQQGSDALDAAAREQGDGARTPVDFMAEFAFALPVTVICELLGVPEEDRAQFRRLTGDLTAALDFVTDLAELGPANEAAVALTKYFAGLIEARRAEPRDDLVSVLAQAADEDGGGLSEDELISNLIVLLVAGFETTTNLLGNGLALLFERPAVMAGLRCGGLPYNDFIEEVLRFDPPVQMTSRVALTGGLRVGGFEVPCEPGAEVMLLIAGANRDPRRYPDPDSFDPLRPDNVPLSFGAGAHYCLGAALARLEAKTAFPLLLNRFPELAPAGPAVRGARYNLRGYQSLPVFVSGGAVSD